MHQPSHIGSKIFGACGAWMHFYHSGVFYIKRNFRKVPTRLVPSYSSTYLHRLEILQRHGASAPLGVFSQQQDVHQNCVSTGSCQCINLFILVVKSLVHVAHECTFTTLRFSTPEGISTNCLLRDWFPPMHQLIRIGWKLHSAIVYLHQMFKTAY